MLFLFYNYVRVQVMKNLFLVSASCATTKLSTDQILHLKLKAVLVWQQ